METNKINHLRHIEVFLNKSVAQYPALDFEVIENDASDNDYTAYEVRVTNMFNERQTGIVLRSNGEQIDRLVGDEFETTDAADFFAALFIAEFIADSVPAV